MHGAALEFEQSLWSLNRPDWISTVSSKIASQGTLTGLGKRHIATYLESGSTLLVTFESHQGIRSLSYQGHPLGWDMRAHLGWSHLALISDGDTWFRDPAVFSFFDELVDDAFFDGFDTILFYGSGPCGYAAAAFSVAAPGAQVLAIQPQATLDPRVTDWDKRFTKMRRTNFTDRYGYAPDMVDAAAQTFVVFDPDQREDAMHAALFTKPNVTKLRARRMGTALQMDLQQMNVLTDLIAAAGEGTLSEARFAALMRARRDHMPYLRRVLSRLDDSNRSTLQDKLCRAVAQRHQTPRFTKRLEQIRKSNPA